MTNKEIAVLWTTYHLTPTRAEFVRVALCANPAESANMFEAVWYAFDHAAGEMGPDMPQGNMN